MRLTRLKIIRHRWCAPTELILGAKRQLVLGKNGTGKTRLLELIARVCAGDLPWLMAEPIEFEAEWSVEETSPHFEGVVKGTLRLTFSCVHRPIQRPRLSAPSIEGARSPDPVVQFRLTFVADSVSALPDVAWECKQGHVADSNGDGWMLDLVQSANLWSNTIGATVGIFLNDTAKFDSGLISRYGVLYRVSTSRRFDEALGEYNLVKSQSARAFEHSESPGESPPFVMWEEGKLFSGPVVVQKLGEGELSVPAMSVSFLRPVERVLHYFPMDVRFRFAGSSGEGRRQFYFDDPRIFLHLPVNGDVITDKDLSFGEKRALSFLAYLYSGEGRHIIIADELMNGLHHSLGVALLDEIGDRQAFLATHEPVLMDNIDFQSADELRRSLIHCERNPDPKGPPFIWSQIDETKAARIFHQYDVASIKHGHELLQDWGIW